MMNNSKATPAHSPSWKSFGAAPSVFWIVTEGNHPDVTDDGEFGVEVAGVPYFYYKHRDAEPSHPDVKYRRIEKYEFGSVIRRPVRES